MASMLNGATMNTKSESSADPRLIRVLKRGGVIEMTDSGWRLFHKGGVRGRKVKPTEFAALHDGGAITRTDDHKSRVGEQWSIAVESSPEQA
jgi:hypothetical protein